MTFLLIGIFIGMVMGLTGSGGALVGIPLYMMILGSTLKEASVLSLVSVILAAIINLIPLARKSDLKTSITLFSTSLIGAYFSVGIKQHLSDFFIALILSAVAIYSLVITWKTAPAQQIDHAQVKLPLAMVTGLILGALTTLTGLGGGVLLMPVLTGAFKFSTERALPTSLLTIFLSSSASLLFQVQGGFELPEIWTMGLLALGIVSAAFGLRQINRLISAQKLNLARKIVFSLVVVLALSKIF